MKNRTQKEWVVKQLKDKGFITRNECLKNYISRLGSIIWNLKNEGWEFDAKYVNFTTPFGRKVKDFKYEVKK